jgi:hypothetical protein
LKNFSKQLDKLVASKKISQSEFEDFVKYFKRLGGLTVSKQKYGDEWLEGVAKSGMSKEIFLDLVIAHQKTGAIDSDKLQSFILQFDEIQKEILVTTQPKVEKYDTDWVETKAMSTITEQGFESILYALEMDKLVSRARLYELK